MEREGTREEEKDIYKKNREEQGMGVENQQLV